MHEQNESQPKAFIKILFALFTALLVVVLGYLCIQIYTIFHRTYKTETAIAYTMSDNITLKGVAVFQAVDVPGSGNLGYVVQDGERVSAGTILAEQYTDDSQGAMRERLDRLDRAILLLTKSENSSGSDLSVLTTQTRTALYNLLDQIDTASYGAIQDAAEDFLLAQNKLQISTGQAAGFGEVLASLQAERDGIRMELSLAIPDQLPISAEELSTVFANALENAIHACEKLPREKRVIHCKCISSPQLMFKISNPYSGEVRFDESGVPVAEQEGHGIGSRSIQAFVRKYGAYCAYQTRDGWFTLTIAL